MSPAVKRALDYVEKTSGLSWFDYMYFRYQKGYQGENYYSMEHMDLLTMMKGIEYLDIQSYIEAKQYEDLENQSKNKNK
jgi:hypothetical protein